MLKLFAFSKKELQSTLYETFGYFSTTNCVSVTSFFTIWDSQAGFISSVFEMSEKIESIRS